MTATSKDFAPIQDDYEFFVGHSTEADADLEAYQEPLRRAGIDSGAVDLLDFGCGPGTFTDRVLERAGWGRGQLRLSLVEPVADYRRQAVERLQSRTSAPILAWDALPAGLAARFDLVVSNHVFYYVPNPTTALEGIARSLRPDGVFLASLAGKDNALIRVWEQAFALLGRPVPYGTAESFEEALGGLRLPYVREEVAWELVFPDSEQNRLKMLRFLLGEHLEALPRTTSLGFFDAHASGRRIAIKTAHYHYSIRPAK